jgi:hypothetical protein
MFMWESLQTSILSDIFASSRLTLIGSGEHMLPNCTTSVQFGTRATLFPNRIDLGLGRAPGTDQFLQPWKTILTRNVERQCEEPVAEKRATRIPGEGLDIPIRIFPVLKVSLFSQGFIRALSESFCSATASMQ